MSPKAVGGKECSFRTAHVFGVFLTLVYVALHPSVEPVLLTSRAFANLSAHYERVVVRLSLDNVRVHKS